MTGRQYLLFEPWAEAIGHAKRRLANMIRKLCESVAKPRQLSGDAGSPGVFACSLLAPG